MKRIFIFILIMMFLASRSYSQTNETLITLDDFIQKALKNYPTPKINAYSLNYAKARLLQAKAINDINLKSDFYKTFAHPIPESTITIDKSGIDTFSFSAEKVLPFSGTRLSAGIGLTDIEQDYASSAFFPAGASQTYFVPEVSFQISQPILKNWLGLLDRLPVQQAELNIKLNRERNKEADEIFILELHNLYYNWILNIEQLKIYTQHYENADALLRQTQKKYKSGVAEAVDLHKTKAITINYKKAMTLYKSQLLNMEKNILTYYTGDTSYQKEIKPDYDYINDPADYQINDLNAADTRKMRILKFSKEVLDKEIMMGKSEKLPQLDLIFSGTLQSYSLNERKFNEFKYDEYTIGLALVYPLGDHMARGNLEAVKSETDKLNNDIEEFRLNYSYNLSQLIEMINTYRIIVQEDRELIQTIKDQLSAERKKYSQGRSGLYYVIEVRNDLLTAELDYIKDIMQFKNLYVQYLDITDKLYAQHVKYR